jgi:hypothetical protein
MSSRLLSIACAFGAVPTAATVALAQCAMCGNSFEPNDPATTAFNTSVLFMMLAPYTIFFAAVGCFVWLHRRGSLGRRATISSLPRRRAIRPPDVPKEVTP